MKIALFLAFICLAAYAVTAAVLGQVSSAPVVSFSFDIKTLVGAVSAIVAGAWWLSKRFQAIDDRLSLQDQQRGRIEETLAKLEKAMAGLQEKGKK